MMAQDEHRSSPAGSSADPMRNGVRFPLHLKVQVETEGGTVDAETEDVSASGVLFRMSAAPAVNTRLAWTMVLPKDTMGAAADTIVHCVGRVVWNAPADGGRQVGAVIDSYRIAEGEQ